VARTQVSALACAAARGGVGLGVHPHTMQAITEHKLGHSRDIILGWFDTFVRGWIGSGKQRA
jgi:hypothetical protein